MPNSLPFFAPPFFKIFIPFGLTYFLSILIGSTWAIMSPILIETFGLSPFNLGFMSSVYLVTFGVAQIPVGVMLDRYGASKTLAPLLLFAAAGTFLFAFAGNMAHLVLSRVFLGIGLAGCLMAAFKAYADWMEVERLPLAYSLQSFSGGLGAMVGTRPLAIAFETASWRTIFFLFAIVVLIASALVFFVVPRKPAQSNRKNTSIFKQFTQMVGFLFDGRFWQVAPITVAGQVVLFAYAFLWLGPWLRDVAMFSEVQTGRYLMLSSGGIALGYLLNGILAEWFVKRRWMSWERLYLFSGTFLTLILACIAIGNPVRWAAFWPLVMFFSNMTMISFPLMRNQFQGDEVGRVLSLLNLMIFFASFFMQWLVGAILELSPVLDGHFSPAGYRTGLLLLVALNMAAAVHYFYCLKRRGA